MSDQLAHSPITGLAFNQIHVDDSATSLAFYERHFGFIKSSDMGANACFGNTGAVGLFISGGHRRAELTENHTRTSATYEVDSAGQLFEQLKADGVRLFQAAPIEMQPGQFADPAGNILEILGPA